MTVIYIIYPLSISRNTCSESFLFKGGGFHPPYPNSSLCILSTDLFHNIAVMVKRYRITVTMLVVDSFDLCHCWKSMTLHNSYTTIAMFLMTIYWYLLVRTPERICCRFQRDCLRTITKGLERSIYILVRPRNDKSSPTPAHSVLHNGAVSDSKFSMCYGKKKTMMMMLMLRKGGCWWTASALQLCQSIALVIASLQK